MNTYMDLRDDRSERIPYDYAEYPIYVRHAFLSGYPDYSALPHWHDDIEFITILDGEMNYSINGAAITMLPGEGVFVNSRQMHFGFSPDHQECEYLCVLVHPLMLCTTPDTERQFIRPILHNTGIPYIHLRAEEKWQREIVESISVIYDVNKTPAAVLKIQSISIGICASIFENMKEAGSVSEPRNNDLFILKNMMGFIQQSYMENITLQEISSNGGIGVSKCCRLFKEYLHQTPNAYLVSYRLDKAASLLRTTDQTITEIAYAAGFNGASYFAEAFHKYFHTSPTEYRNDHSAAHFPK